MSVRWLVRSYKKMESGKGLDDKYYPQTIVDFAPTPEHVEQLGATVVDIADLLENCSKNSEQRWTQQDAEILRARGFELDDSDIVRAREVDMSLGNGQPGVNRLQEPQLDPKIIAGLVGVGIILIVGIAIGYGVCSYRFSAPPN